MALRNLAIAFQLSSLAALALAGACSTSYFGKAGERHAAGNADATTAQAPSSPQAGNAGAPFGDSTPGLSRHANVRYKKLRLLRQDLANALALAPNQLCVENGHDCLQNYKVTLGSNDLNLTLYATAEAPAVTTAIALDRITVQACAKRVAMDQAGTPVLFAGVPVAAAAFTPAMGSAVLRLYHAFLQRDPTAVETAALQELFTNVVAKVGPAAAGQAWATLACWTVGTSLEAVLY